MKRWINKLNNRLAGELPRLIMDFWVFGTVVLLDVSWMFIFVFALAIKELIGWKRRCLVAEIELKQLRRRLP